MTFEPDGGGWNNIRMAMETVVGLAIATGRTLVLPAEQRMYLLGQERGKEKTDFSFMDFFPMQELANDNEGLTMITMQEFLETEAMTGHLFYKDTGEVAFPPENQTDWNGKDVKLLKEWLRNVTHTPLWSPSKCLAVFPASGEQKDAAALQQMVEHIGRQGYARTEVLDQPLPVDAMTVERMRESLVQRKELCLYDEQMQSEYVVHFMCNHKMHVRMLVHFYAFLFFEDWREDLWMKRYVLLLWLCRLDLGEVLATNVGSSP
jgi:GDP-fucose protein O-fucosyltransferase